MTGPLLAIFAHPDDETFSTAGLLAAAVARGVPATVVSATRGEAGESSIPGLDDPERLGEVREEELREAMRQLDVSDVRFLDYRDSGLNPAAIKHPNACVHAAPEDIAAKLTPLIRTLRPEVIVTFGPEGIYGHPDHIHMHHVTLLAIQAAAAATPEGDPSGEPWQTPRLYFAAAPREDMLAMAARPDSPLAFLSPEMLANLGTPRTEITHVLDVTPWAEQKRAAILAHRTQTGEGGPLSAMPAEMIERQLSREYFVHVPLPWQTSEDAQDVIALLATEQPRG